MKEVASSSYKKVMIIFYLLNGLFTVSLTLAVFRGNWLAVTGYAFSLVMNFFCLYIIREHKNIYESSLSTIEYLTNVNLKLRERNMQLAGGKYEPKTRTLN